ncbi:MAG: chitobiase/beta-hexosaminidase C-terminal domain-containing protein [Treponema sp.]|nr:chitobiase/beta-hexosaminidase C-terminal domain-containing protein [Treponema sp.]
MKKFMKVLALVLSAAILMAGITSCSNDTDDDTIAVTSVTLSKKSTDITVGSSETLTATVSPDNATDKTVTWSSSNTDVAIVDNGLVSALTAGETVITAKAGDKTATCTVTVKNQVATPTFSEKSGAVDSGTKVEINCTTKDAVIYYTTDDNDPTSASTKYTGAISITTAVTIKAIAVAEGYTNSDVASVSYTIKEVKVDYSVGADIKINDIDYVVVNNDFKENESRAVLSSNLYVSLVSIKNAIVSVNKVYGKHILLLRRSGKLTVPKNEVDDYSFAKEQLKNSIPESAEISDFFNTNTTESDAKVYYRDIYAILDFNFKQIGAVDTMWHSNYSLKNSSGETVNLKDLAKVFDVVTIRNNCPTEYKVKNTENLMVEDYYYDEEVLTHYVVSPKKAWYWGIRMGTDERKLSSTEHLVTYIDSEGNWVNSQLFLLTSYTSDSRGVSGSLLVRKNGARYQYWFAGASNSSSKTSPKTTFEFDENGKYTGENIELTEENAQNWGITFPIDTGALGANSYDSETLPYNAETRSIPVEFVLNEDGSVSFGPKVLEWADNWHTYVIEHNANTSDYEE